MSYAPEPVPFEAYGDRENNILMRPNGEAVLSDIGILEFTEDIAIGLTNCGHVSDIRWLAPEVLLGKRRTTKSDIYSLGNIMLGQCSVGRELDMLNADASLHSGI